MIERFTGSVGATALKDALLQQRLVQHDDVEHAPGGVLIKQGHADDVLFFILAGEA